VKALVIYDTVYGCTEKIAVAIAAAFDPPAKAVRPAAVNMTELTSLDLLVVGAPTQGGRPTPPVQHFLDSIPGGSLSNLKVAVFDTRISAREHGLGIKLLTGAIGYASGRIAAALEAKGAHLIAPVEGFIVEGREGPLRAGEAERAAAWARSLALPPNSTG
jgi:flavodoxin I